MITWICKNFNELSTGELYAILRLRSQVFVVEQNCVFLDMDDKDQLSYHLMGWEQDLLKAYTRLLPPGIAYAEMSIGRVVNSSAARGTGVGRVLMQQSINECRKLFGNGIIKIGAQLYLKDFYGSLGFVPTGGIYPEDGIDHIHMQLL